MANYNLKIMTNKTEYSIGKVIRQQRISIPLTLQELAAKSGVSASHLGRIERGDRFPSAHVLRKIAKPLELNEDELFVLAGFLSPHTSEIDEDEGNRVNRQLDPYVARVLSQETVEVQRAVIGILTILKSIARNSSS